MVNQCTGENKQPAMRQTNLLVQLNRVWSIAFCINFCLLVHAGLFPQIRVVI